MVGPNRRVENTRSSKAWGSGGLCGRRGIVNLSGLGTFVTEQSVVSRWSQRAVTVRHTEKDRDRKNR